MDQQFIDALHEQDKIDQLVVDLDLAQYDNVVLSVNNKTGAVVLVTTDIAEGTNLYYTNARADERVALLIDDTLTNLTKAWSSQKITDAISLGVVASAAKWTNVMNFNFGGDLVGNGGFDGSSTATFSATVPGKVDNARVLTDVPAGALFTDTAYDDTTIWAAVNLNTAKTGITASQAADIETNNAKVGITPTQSSDITANTSGLNSHTANVSNPHAVTKSQVGLGSADNTSDANKPISNATLTALEGKQDADANHGITRGNLTGGGWTKFPDGTLTAWGTFTHGGQCSYPAGALYSGYAMTEHSTGVTFAATPRVVLSSASGGTTVLITPQLGSVSTTTIECRPMSTVALTSEGFSIGWVATGRWK